MRPLRVGLSRWCAAALLSCAVLATAGAGAVAAGVVSASPAAADTNIFLGSGWGRIFWGAPDSHVTGGPFTFTSTGPVVVRLTDAYYPGDQLELFDNDREVGTTNAVATSDETLCATGDTCWANAGMSHGSFVLPAGTHSLDIVAVASPHPEGGAGFIEVHEVAETQVVASASPASPHYGEGVTFSAELNPFPTDGSVTVKVYRADVNQWTELCTAAVPAVAPADHKVSCSYPASASLGSGQPELKVGTHPVDVAYSGGTDFSAGANGFDLTVQRGVTSTVASVATVPVGASATLHALVTPAASGTSAVPTGTVVFHLGSAAGPVVDSGAVAPDGTASGTLSVAVPGEQVVAVYGGDVNFEGSVSGGASVSAPCSSVIQDVSVPSVVATSGTVCLNHATVTGPVVVAGQASVVVTDSSIGGSVTDNSGGALVVCGSTVQGSVVVQNAKGLVVVGDPAVQCGGNTVGQSIVLVSNRHGVAAVGNTYGTAFTAVANSGNGPAPGDVGPVIGPNTKAGQIG